MGLVHAGCNANSANTQRSTTCLDPCVDFGVYMISILDVH